MLHLAIIALATVMLAQAMALPNPNPAPTGIPQLARVWIASRIDRQYQHADCATPQFDNDPGLPAVGITPTNVYLDIFWKGMSLAETEASTVPDLPSLIPNSPPNFAAFSPKNAATMLQGTPEMTTVYDDSTVTSLTLHSFFYGCSLGTEQSLVSVPLSCNITITGFSSSGNQTAQQIFAFVADGLEQQMVQAKPSGFSGVQYITFAFQAATGTVALIDTVSYDVLSA